MDRKQAAKRGSGAGPRSRKRAPAPAPVAKRGGGRRAGPASKTGRKSAPQGQSKRLTLEQKLLHCHFDQLVGKLDPAGADNENSDDDEFAEYSLEEIEEYAAKLEVEAKEAEDEFNKVFGLNGEGTGSNEDPEEQEKRKLLCAEFCQLHWEKHALLEVKAAFSKTEDYYMLAQNNQQLDVSFDGMLHDIITELELEKKKEQELAEGPPEPKISMKKKQKPTIDAAAPEVKKRKTPGSKKNKESKSQEKDICAMPMSPMSVDYGYGTEVNLSEPESDSDHEGFLEVPVKEIVRNDPIMDMLREKELQV